MNICLMIGAPGSGKSHYCGVNFPSLKIISCDEIREEHFGLTRSYEIRETVKERMKELIVDMVENSTDKIVIDTTYFNELSERKFLFEFGPSVLVSAVYIHSSLELCLKRNRQRRAERRVADDMVAMLHSKVCPPEYSEGFYSIEVVDYKLDLN
ncbi:MAG: AAA family ATPase [Pseudomonas sp.]|nr:AAA family ATPase [Pseudomonas sp.]